MPCQSTEDTIIDGAFPVGKMKNRFNSFLYLVYFLSRIFLHFLNHLSNQRHLAWDWYFICWVAFDILLKEYNVCYQMCLHFCITCGFFSQLSPQTVGFLLLVLLSNPLVETKTEGLNNWRSCIFRERPLSGF